MAAVLCQRPYSLTCGNLGLTGIYFRGAYRSLSCAH